MPLANERSYPVVHRSVLRQHIAKTTEDANIPLRSTTRPIPGYTVAFVAIIFVLILYQLY